MRLYELQLTNDKLAGYDCAYGFVVRAKSPKEARKLATQWKGDEGDEAWLNPKNSSCNILRQEGDAEMILRDFNAG